MATVELPQYELHVAGGSLPPADGRFYETVDPYTGEPWARVPDAGEADVDRAVAGVRDARPWLPGVGIDGLVEATVSRREAPARDMQLVLREFDRGHARTIRR